MFCGKLKLQAYNIHVTFWYENSKKSVRRKASREQKNHLILFDSVVNKKEGAGVIIVEVQSLINSSSFEFQFLQLYLWRSF